MAKVEWHPGELYPRVGYIVTNLSRPADGISGAGNTWQCSKFSLGLLANFMTLALPAVLQIGASSVT